MSRRYAFTSLVLLLATRTVSLAAADPAEQDLERRFTATVRPFLTTYCETCHSGAKPTAQLDLRQYTTLTAIAQDYQRWTLLREKLAKKAMPPAALPQPSPEARQQIVDWIDAALKHEAAKNAGDPGIVLARRLSNAEYNYTVRDLTGVDIQPAKEFPVDPANPGGLRQLRANRSTCPPPCSTSICTRRAKLPTTWCSSRTASPSPRASRSPRPIATSIASSRSSISITGRTPITPITS